MELIIILFVVVFTISRLTLVVCKKTYECKVNIEQAHAIHFKFNFLSLKKKGLFGKYYNGRRFQYQFTIDFRMFSDARFSF